MRKGIGLLLALALLVSVCAPAFAAGDAIILTRQALRVNGAEAACEVYNVNGYNYFKLRDLAYLLNGTDSRFAVGYDEPTRTMTVRTGMAYTPNGSELVQRGDLSGSAQVSAQKLLIDGKERGDLRAYNIGGYNFFKLRDLGNALGFGVDYDEDSGTMLVDSYTTRQLSLRDGIMPVPLGERVRADFDGDGTAETVRVWLECPPNGWGFGVHLCIDGTDRSDELMALVQYFDAPDESIWLITDVDAADGLLEIAVQDWGPSDDPVTAFFRYDGRTLRYLGKVEGFLSFDGHTASAEVSGSGVVCSRMRLDVLQTWWAMTDYAVGADGRFAPQPQDFYTSTFANQQTTLQRALYGYADRAGRPRVLPAGTTARIVGTDNARWVLLTLSDGSDCWLKLGEHGYQLEGPDGGVDSWLALSDLCMAD